MLLQWAKEELEARAEQEKRDEERKELEARAEQEKRDEERKEGDKDGKSDSDDDSEDETEESSGDDDAATPPARVAPLHCNERCLSLLVTVFTPPFRTVHPRIPAQAKTDMGPTPDTPPAVDRVVRSSVLQVLRI